MTFSRVADFLNAQSMPSLRTSYWKDDGFMQKFIFGLVLKCLVLALVASPVYAQAKKAKVGDRIGAWTFQCQAISADQNVCALVQAVLNKKTNKQVMRAVIRSVGAGKAQKMGLFITLPLGIFLAPGVAGKVDEGKQFSFVLQACREGGCEAAIELDSKLQKAMKSGKTLVVGFKTSAGADAVGIPLSLNGITAGLAALK